jgi:transcription elongation factor Elf1
MAQPIQINCDRCGSSAEVMMNGHVNADGQKIEWPKATVKADGIYFTIHCPQCGQQEQCMARPDDT